MLVCLGWRRWRYGIWISFQQDSQFLEFWLISSDIIEASKFSLSIEKS